MTAPPVFYEGKVHVCEEMCSTCIFRPGNLMHLHPGRVRQMVDEADEQDGTIVCHQTLDSETGLACRGYFDRPKLPLTLTLADRLGLIEEGRPPTKDSP